jgi:hypothetical protein
LCYTFLMNIILSFLPIVVYSLIASGLYFGNKLTFNIQSVMLLVAITANIVISINTHHDLWIPVAQAVLAGLVFVALVFFMGGKASGETFLTMCAIIALTPMPEGILPVILIFVIFTVVAVVTLKKQNDSALFYVQETILSSGLANSLPDYSHLPERKETVSAANAKKVSLLPYVASVMILATLFYSIQYLLADK